MTQNPAPSDLILVCITPDPKDMEYARLLGWYRIPLKHAPKVVGTDYLAFYQPSSFGAGHKAMIEYIAPVRGVELVLRRDLIQGELNHPRANEEYYKIVLGDLQKLPTPIKAGDWKRITFFYTIGSLLLNAKNIRDLVVDRTQEKHFQHILNDLGSKYKDLQLESGEVQLLQNEILEYLFSQNDIIRKTNLF